MRNTFFKWYIQLDVILWIKSKMAAALTYLFSTSELNKLKSHKKPLLHKGSLVMRNAFLMLVLH